METRHFIETLDKENVKTFFLSTLIALNVKWVPLLMELPKVLLKQFSSMFCLNLNLKFEFEISCVILFKSLLNYVPYVPRALCALMPHLPRALMPRALRALVPYVPRALCALIPYVPRVLRALVPYVLSCPTCLLPFVPRAL